MDGDRQNAKLVLPLYAKEITVAILCPRLGARSGVNWADLMAAQGAYGTDFYDRSIYSVQSIVPTIVLVDLSGQP